MKDEKRLVYLAVPTHTGEIAMQTARSLIQGIVNAGGRFNVMFSINCFSLLCSNFNQLWAKAVNCGADYFVMLHSDVGSTDPAWLVNLIDQLDHSELDALSAVVRIKGDQMDTSTALYTPQGIERIPVADFRDLPPIIKQHHITRKYGDKVLLINTGMLAIRLKQDWAQDFCFTIEDNVTKTDEGLVTLQISEDWYMSLWFEARGIPYGCTQLIPTLHQGVNVWAMGVDYSPYERK